MWIITKQDVVIHRWVVYPRWSLKQNRAKANKKLGRPRHLKHVTSLRKLNLLYPPSSTAYWRLPCPNNVSSDTSTDQGLRRITVTVTAPDSTQTVLVGLRSIHGAMEQSPSEEKTFVTWVGSKLQVGAGTTVVRSGTNITNHTEDE